MSTKLENAAGNQGAATIGLKQAAAICRYVGFTRDEAVTMVAIGLAESSLISNNRGPVIASGKWTGYRGFGIWMILAKWDKPPLGWDNPITNGRYAFVKFKTQGFGAWTASRGTWGTSQKRQDIRSAVDAIYNTTQAQLNKIIKALDAAQAHSSADLPGSTGISGLGTDIVGGAADIASSWKDAIANFLSTLTSGATWVRVGAVVGGAILLIIGLKLFADEAAPNLLKLGTA